MVFNGAVVQDFEGEGECGEGVHDGVELGSKGMCDSV